MTVASGASSSPQPTRCILGDFCHRKPSAGGVGVSSRDGMRVRWDRALPLAALVLFWILAVLAWRWLG